jgi:glutamate-1-semialdehyde 2,1-aminomutase
MKSMSQPFVSPVAEIFRKTFARSAELAEQSREIFPAGVTHDLRYMEPFPIYIDHQQGSKKWTVEGKELIDFWSGHGAMILGHSHPKVVAAVQQAAAKMSHAGGNHQGEIEWGKLVQKLVPSAEKVRFTGSGTEATLMALRLSRMFTGRKKLLKFAGHFHGWHDLVVPSADAPFYQPTSPGIPEELSKLTVVVPPNDPEVLENTLKNDPDIAAVILEPTGGHWGAVPIRGPFLEAVRALTQKYGQVLIFDEVITGFRVAPGGAQEVYDIKPDLTSLAKILAGGLPGGALVGRSDILSQIDFRPGKPKMRHPGTYNGNPISSAAGIAALTEIATGEPSKRANEMGRRIRNRLNQAFSDENLPCVAYIDFSMFRIIPNYDGPRPDAATTTNNGFIPYEGSLEKLDGVTDRSRVHAFRQAVLLEGVDMPGLAGWIMAAHSEQDIDFAVGAIIRAAKKVLV